MHSKLISRIAMTSRVILVVSFCLAIYLAMSAPATFIVTDRQETLAKIEAATSITELKARASGLAMVGNNATEICRVLFGIAVWTLLVFTVLSILNLIWLRKLKRATDEHPTA
jgi:hypothetical protein